MSSKQGPRFAGMRMTANAVSRRHVVTHPSNHAMEAMA
jgi:hypothetical protein